MPRILIVEDSAFQHTFLRNVLAPQGYDLVFVTNGVEALEALDAARHGQAFDGILADLIMPKMRGLTLLEKLRERDDAPPVVILTADIQEHMRAKCLGLGALDVLHKPVRPDVLRRALAKALHEAPDQTLGPGRDQR